MLHQSGSVTLAPPCVYVLPAMLPPVFFITFTVANGVVMLIAGSPGINELAAACSIDFNALTELADTVVI
jgi:hypothetical protein